MLEDVLFHCQQAAEKSMKGFLTFHQRPFIKTYDLRVLGKGCVEVDPSLRPIVERAMPLTAYAWKFRYPGSVEEPQAEEVDIALKAARELVSMLLCRLPADIRD